MINEIEKNKEKTMREDFEKYSKVTYEQIEIMKYTIGFKNAKVTGTKNRKYSPYRNYFCCDRATKSKCFDIIQQLCKIGLMCEEDIDNTMYNYFFVTDEGKKFLELVTGIEILKDLE